MKIVDFDPKVCIALSDESDGNMKHPDLVNWVNDEIIGYRQKFLESAKIDPQNVALIRADYNSEDFCKYQVIEGADNYRLDLLVTGIPASDGLATKTPGVGIFLPIADCLGVVIYDPEQRVLMVVHCGRHNLEQNGLVKAVELLKKQGSQPQGMKAWFSPSASANNYPVHAFDGKSLAQVGREQLENMGVSKIIVDEADTTVEGNYFSHSQGDRNERFAILAYIN